MKHTVFFFFFLMLNLKHKPLFSEAGPYGSISFLVSGSGAHVLSHEETGLALRTALIHPLKQERDRQARWLMVF